MSHREFDRSTDGRGGRQSFLSPKTFQHAGLRGALDDFGRGQCRHQERSALYHHARAFFVEKRSVLDRRDAGAHGQLDSFGAVLCAATLRSSLFASSTSAFNSSKPYCVAPTASPSDRTPPVAQVLITSAPYLICRRTAWRICSGPSATPVSGDCSATPGRYPFSSQCPPVMPIAWPAVSMRGPIVQPSLMALRKAMSSKRPEAPTLRTLVNPAIRVSRACSTPRIAPNDS